MRPAYRGFTHLATLIANMAAHPATQIIVALSCILWIAVGGGTARLASVASIGGLILTQMVLHQQRRREIALHLKIDELILSKRGARDEVAGIEHMTEEEIEEIRGGRDLE